MPQVDLVLEGGGVKGIALVGAIVALDRAGYTFNRVAGTSAGAIVAAMLAAGMPPASMVKEMRELDYKQMEDGSRLSRLGMVGESLSVLLQHGAFRGDYLHDWVAHKLAAYGVRTWADLRRPDLGDELPVEERYRLVVIVSDISRGKMLRLPWDYSELCGLDPDAQSVAHAVRASASIPFFFEPVRLSCGGGHEEHDITLVDGGLLSNFPVDIFDRSDSSKPCPTFGIKLSARPNSQKDMSHPVASGMQMALAIIETMAHAHDQRYVDDPEVQQRTIFVDTMAVRPTHFAIDPTTREQLFTNGVDAATRFLAQQPVTIHEQPAPTDHMPAPVCR